MRKTLLLVTLLAATTIIQSCSKELLHAVQEEQANDIIAVLSEYGIQAEKVADGRQESSSYNIVVQESDYKAAWNILKENGLPREKIRGLSDVYQKQGLISSSTEEKALLMQAIKGEVEKTLETIDNVIKARVIISVPGPSQNPFADSKEPTGAAVLLKIKKGSYINSETVKGILMGAVSSLSRERISVEIVESSGTVAAKPLRMTYIGPFLVPESSARNFYLIITGLLSILSLGVIIFVFFHFRKKPVITKEAEEF